MLGGRGTHRLASLLQFSFFFGYSLIRGSIRRRHGLVARGDLPRGLSGKAFRTQYLLTAGAHIEPVQAAPHETETMRGPRLLWLKDRRKTNLHHQSRQKGNDEGQHRINPNPHHADLIRQNVTAFFGRLLN